MELPGPFQSLVNQKLSQLRTDPAHQLKPVERLALYRAFETQAPAAGLTRQWLGHLELLSARKVLPIWEEAATSLAYLPLQLIIVALDILESRVVSHSGIVNDLLDRAYHFFGQLEFEELGANYLAAGQTAYVALSHLVYWPPRFLTIIDATREDSQFPEDDGVDAAGWAVNGYAAICEENYPTNQLSPASSLEFWEWWLTEAIPKAWELAHHRAAS